MEPTPSVHPTQSEIKETLELVRNGLPFAENAECRDFPEPDIFFETKDNPTNLKIARLLCSICVVKTECLDYALRTNQKFGVFGGTTASERVRLRQIPLNEINTRFEG